ncbi:MAG: hypothetical protein LAQ69_26515 [Acidobacteriia bacterium]|nr:hypothetical protein [Terriglobia bacterium]
MKFATFALLGILLLGSFASVKAADPVGASQMAMAFTGDSVMTSDSTGICVIWFPILGSFDLKSLFMGPLFGAPAVDKEHAYLIFVSDWSMTVLPPNKDFNFLGLFLPGEATIYYSNRPDLRDWSDWTNRSTWGEPVAKFVRTAGLFQSTDGGVSGTVTFSQTLVSSSTFTLNGKPFNFKDLIPHGMTCNETGVGEVESGTCFAIGAGQ